MAKSVMWQGVVGYCVGCQTEREIGIIETEYMCPQCSNRMDIRPNWVDSYEKKQSTTAIPYPKTDTEAEVMCYLLCELRDLEWDVRAVFNRFDLIVYNARREAVRVIEVKDKLPLANARLFVNDEFVYWHKGTAAEAQLNTYRAFGIPVDYVLGMSRARQYVDWAKKRRTPERRGTPTMWSA